MSQHDALNSSQPDLSLVIVNYKTRDLLLALLESIYDGADDLRLECIVLDNASFDGSAQAVAARFPQVRFVQNDDESLLLSGVYARHPDWRRAHTCWC
jgi:glycosyltransferase involved in cell wall biosynthesis